MEVRTKRSHERGVASILNERLYVETSTTEWLLGCYSGETGVIPQIRDPHTVCPVGEGLGWSERGEVKKLGKE